MWQHYAREQRTDAFDSEGFMTLRLTTMHGNARSPLECGSEAAALIPDGKAVAGATALQGAFGTTIFMAVAHARRLTGTQKL
jgi:hypothetical protein